MLYPFSMVRELNNKAINQFLLTHTAKQKSNSQSRSRVEKGGGEERGENPHQLAIFQQAD